ncbi:MAG: HAMP domain-containing histidine kinase [Puniceicoccales bacterium]|jgi:signal transduction histidine kinase|nr:HAMP domain-containing histidine kinase [Puniceicoccales bacterium]
MFDLCLFLFFLAIVVIVYQCVVVANLKCNLGRERESNMTKGAFVGLISHEFRTPMATIKASSDLIANFRDRLNRQEVDESLKNISDCILRMTKMMDDILLLGKMQSNQIKFHAKLVDIVALLHDVIRDVDNVSDNNRVVMISNVGEKYNLVLDPTLIYHIASNLLSNALKYSEDDKKVELHIDVSDGVLSIEVVDQGIGIPKNEVKHLFDLFHRCSNIGNRSGIGIGLFMIRQCVALHKGTVTLKTSENVGSTFTVRIPVYNQIVSSDEIE